MAGFWAGFADATDRIMERKSRKEELEMTLGAKRRDKLLDLYGTIKSKRADAQAEAGKYVYSVEALATRLRDEEGNLLPGADKLLENPEAAHKVLTKINEIEQQAAKDDNAYTPLLWGENILDNFTAYGSSGEQVVTPDVDIDAIFAPALSGEYLTQEEFEKTFMTGYDAIPSTAARPEALVQVKPEIMRKPSDETFEPGREVFKAQIMDMLTQDLAALENQPDNAETQNRFDELNQLSEALNKEGALSDQAMVKLHDMYGAEAFARLKRLEKTSPTIQRVDEDPLLERSMRAYYIPLLKQRAEDPNLSEEDRMKAREYLEQRFGVSY